METESRPTWRIVVSTLGATTMSIIVPVDLLSYATNPTYISTLVSTGASDPTTIEILAYDQNFSSVIGENATARQLFNLSYEAFHEGGVFNKHTSKFYATSNWADDHNNPVNVTVIDLANNYSLSSARYSALSGANGGTSYFPPGAESNASFPPRIAFCDQGDFDEYSALVSVDPFTGSSEKILTSFLGRKISSINDVRQHPETGDLWFTDADYGYLQKCRPAPTIPKHVYRFSPQTGEIVVAADGFVQPNGLEFSPDLQTLHVSDTGAAEVDMNLTRPGTLYAFDVIRKISLAGRRTFAYADDGLPVGVHRDLEGNVWADCGDSVHIWSPEGSLLGKAWTFSWTPTFALLPDADLVFSNAQLCIVEEISAKGSDICRDLGVC
ncbi:Gluconolactonase 2 [Stagonosporopsis vannaccii]|nr:Gluconolactonase 2 [Stagonosporopsis vannaccii]